MTIGVAAAGCGRPVSPSGTPSLVVRFTDEVTGQLVTDVLVGLVAHVEGPSASNSAAVNGIATFSDLPSTTYTVTATAKYGYAVLDVFHVTLTESRTVEFQLRPKNDVIVTEVFVDGQGAVPPGGAIDVSDAGITLHLRGKYLAWSAPWPAPKSFDVGFIAAASRLKYADVTQSPSDWEALHTQWKPCTNVVGGGVACFTHVDSIQANMNDLQFRPSVSLAGRTQPWPVTFRLAADCCTLPPVR